MGSRNYTPLRYPGGKAKLFPYLKEVLHENRLYDFDYAEPYAGGAGVAASRPRGPRLGQDDPVGGAGLEIPP